MNASNRALSAFTPAHASRPSAPEFAMPLQVYLIETIERETRTRVYRQMALVASLVFGIFVCQSPVGFSSAIAVPTLPVSAQSVGARIAIPDRSAIPEDIGVERMVFAPLLQQHIAAR